VSAGLTLVGGFAAILAGAFLFTNAVEWLGHRLGWDVGAVGSVLAAVSTALPESIIPVVAIVKGGADSDAVAIGAILGAPFMLATIAMALVGVAALAFRRRRGGRSLRTDHRRLARDLAFFVLVLAAALTLGLGVPAPLRYALAPLFVLAYTLYLWRTLAREGEVTDEHELPDLYVDPTKHDPPTTAMIAAQFLAGLGLIVVGAHVFVDALVSVAESVGVSPLVLSLLIAPLATELPEKANSFLWIREGKDALALGNITGAMVFQSTVPVAFGLLFTSWNLDGFAFLATSLALAGGLVAVWSLHLRRSFSAVAIAIWATLFGVFAASVLLGG
jgi:cation:H+ antiporter